jgi:PAS domain S-box-containing protein
VTLATDVGELKQILDSTPFLLARCSPDLRYLYVSKSYAANFGRTQDELIGKRLSDVMGPEAFAKIRPRAEAALRGERVEFEEEIAFPNAPRRIYHVILTPERDDRGEIIGYISSVNDITERKLSERKLASQLAATQRLQEISTQLLGEENIEDLYQKIVDAASSIMHADSASLQVFIAARGQLRLLASRGFNEEAKACWKWVSTETKTACGEALRTRRRVIVPDVRTSNIIVGPDLELHLKNGVLAAQTTPLVSRTGRLVGMISTHWCHAHQPQEQELVSLDVLARQAADLMERSLTEEHTRHLVREVSHRAKNLLAVVQGIIQQTVAEEDGAKIWSAELSARLAALAASQELIVQSDWSGVDIDALVRSQLQHLTTLVGTRIRLEGASVRIAPFAAQTLGMAFCELATNAVKYGALSNGTGTVFIDWSLAGDSDAAFRVNWQERDGPTVRPPERHGFGSDVTIQMVEHALDARVRMEYDPLGVSWRVSAPRATVLAAAQSGTGNFQSGGAA